MRRTPVDECPAGPAMDAAVAVALGQVVELSQGTAFQRIAVQYAGDITPADDRRKYEWVVVSPYSTDIAAAWELVDKLIQDHEFYITNYYSPDGWSANYRKNAGLDWNSTDAKTAPLAISRAFLKANGVEFVEVPE